MPVTKGVSLSITSGHGLYLYSNLSKIMEDLANPFKSIAPTAPIPLPIDYVPLENAVATNSDNVKVVTNT